MSSMLVSPCQVSESSQDPQLDHTFRTLQQNNRKVELPINESKITMMSLEFSLVFE